MNPTKGAGRQLASSHSCRRQRICRTQSPRARATRCLCLRLKPGSSSKNVCLSATFTLPSTSQCIGRPARVPANIAARYTLLQVFSKYGKISKLDFLFHKSGPLKGKPRGYAFVEYASENVRVCCHPCLPLAHPGSLSMCTVPLSLRPASTYIPAFNPLARTQP